MLAAWAGLAINLFTQEVRLLKTTAQLADLSYDEKKHLLDGPIYELVKEVRKNVAQDRSVAFVGPKRFGALNYDYKFRYYLYPRKVRLLKADNIDLEEIKNSSYFAFSIPVEEFDLLQSSLDKAPLLQPIAAKRGVWNNVDWTHGLLAVTREWAP